MAKIFNGRLLTNMFKLDLEKAEEPEIKLPTPVGSLKKQEHSRKTSTSVLLTMPKPLIVWITTNCGKFFKRWEYQITLLAPEKSVCRSRSNSSWTVLVQEATEPDMEQWTGSKLGKEYVKAVYCHPAYLTYIQSTSYKCRAGWSKSWNQDCQEKYQYPQICRWYHPYGRKGRTKEPLDESERGEWKSWLKTQHSEN